MTLQLFLTSIIGMLVTWQLAIMHWLFSALFLVSVITFIVTGLQLIWGFL